jgi:hypothetical protein
MNSLHAGPADEALLTVAEVASWIGLSSEGVRLAIRNGRVPAQRSGGVLVLSRADVARVWPDRSRGQAPRLRLVRGGPQSSEGKARSSMNAMRHGAFASDVVIRSGALKEDPAEFERFTADYVEHFCPQSNAERRKLFDIVEVEWRRRRLRRAQRAALEGVGDDADGLASSALYYAQTRQHAFENLRSALFEIEPGARALASWASVSVTSVVDLHRHVLAREDAKATAEVAQKVRGGVAVEVMANTADASEILNLACGAAATWIGGVIDEATREVATLTQQLRLLRDDPQRRAHAERGLVLDDHRQSALDRHEAHLARMASRLLVELTDMQRQRAALRGSF